MTTLFSKSKAYQEDVIGNEEEMLGDLELEDADGDWDTDDDDIPLNVVVDDAVKYANGDHEAEEEEDNISVYTKEDTVAGESAGQLTQGNYRRTRSGRALNTGLSYVEVEEEDPF